MKIMVALDDTTHSRPVLKMLLSRVWPPGTIIELVTVADSNQSPFDRQADAQRACELLDEAGRMVASVLPAVRITSRVLLGPVKETLLAHARTAGADLIIVGTRGAQGVSLALLGSVSQAVLERAPCPVLIAKSVGYDSDTEPVHILLPVDHSGPSETAFQWALRQSWPADAHVHLMTVISPLSQEYAEEPSVERAEVMLEDFEAVRCQAVRTLEGYAQDLKRHSGVETVIYSIAEGEPASEILRTASEWPADLIVMGSHGRTGFGRVLLGSVSRAVSLGSPCSVEIARQALSSDVSTESVEADRDLPTASSLDRMPHVGFM